MRLIRAGILAFGLVLVTTQSALAKGPVDPDGYLRVFHGVQGAAALPLAVTLDGRPAGWVAWGQATAWQATKPGRHQITVTGPPGTGATSLTIGIQAGCLSTVFAGQPDSAVPAVRLVPHRDCARERIPPSDARITTVFAANPDFGPVEFRAAGRTLPLLLYRPAGSLLVPAGESRLTIGAVGTAESFATTTAVLAPGNAYTVVWAGGGERAAGTLSVLQDAAQSPEAPPVASVQPINTGMADSFRGAGWWPALAIVVAATVILACRRVARSETLLLTLLIASGVAACAGQGASDPDTLPPATSSGRAAWAPGDATPSSQAPVVARHGTAPTRIRIEALRLDRPVVPLSMEELARLPRSLALDEVGWLSSTSPAGAAGTTAMLGHTDFSGGGAFARLGSIRPGDEIHVTDADGRTLVYVARLVLTVPKAEFPAEIWAPQPAPFLVLVTCDGPRHPATGLHTDNVLVWAVARG